MKLLIMRKGGNYALGVKTNRGILPVDTASRELGQKVPTSMEELLQDADSNLKALGRLVAEAENKLSASLWLEEEQVEFAPCVTGPEKILCVGLNYKKHAIETNHPIPTSPVLFSKFANALSGHGQVVELPRVAREFDYEVELVIVMGKEAKEVREEEALSYVFGYSAGNDLSARDLQMKTSQWLLGKTCDGFAPVGPYLVTADEITDPNNLVLESRVNG